MEQKDSKLVTSEKESPGGNRRGKKRHGKPEGSSRAVAGEKDKDGKGRRRRDTPDPEEGEEEEEDDGQDKDAVTDTDDDEEEEDRRGRRTSSRSSGGRSFGSDSENARR